MARAKKKGETRNVRIVVYVTPSEAEALRKQADKEDKTVSDMLPDLWLGTMQ